MNSNSKTVEGLSAGQNKFYMAIDDVTIYFGKKGCMKRYFVDFEDHITVDDLTEEELKNVKFHPYDERNFSNKFVKDPVQAVINVLCHDKEDYKKAYCPCVRKEILQNIRFNPQNNTYIYNEYGTDGTLLPPKPHHMKMFEKGEYEFFRIQHEIQVVSTNIETFDLNAVQTQLKAEEEKK